MPKNRELTAFIVGDVYVRRDDPPSVFQHVKDLLRSADFTLGNLEGSVADSGVAREKGGAAVMRAHTSYQPPARYFEAPGSPPIIHSWVSPQHKAQLTADVAAARKLA